VNSASIGRRTLRTSPRMEDRAERQQAEGSLSFRARVVAAQSPLVGTFVKLASLEVVEMVALAGFDFVVIDTEHALLSVSDVYTMVAFYSACGVLPLVRVADHGYGDAQRYLDSGASGVLIPHVSSPEQARTVVKQLLFPPTGSRGFGYTSRAGQWGQLPGGAAAYLRRGDQDTARIAMIEDAAAADSIREIIAVDGLDCVFVGPGDLSVSMGAAVTDPAVERIVASVIAQAVEAGVPVGTVVSGTEQAQLRQIQGCSFILAGNDATTFSIAIQALLDPIRQTLSLDRQPSGSS
jgi:4-hydroxy-2-oxoheptanedioate aldolase